MQVCIRKFCPFRIILFRIFDIIYRFCKAISVSKHQVGTYIEIIVRKTIDIKFQLVLTVNDCDQNR